MNSDKTGNKRQQNLTKRRTAAGWIRISNLWLNPEQAAELSRRMLPGETGPAAVLRLLGLTNDDEE